MSEQETKTPSVAEEARELSYDYFKQGLNCAECVLMSFLDTHETDLPPEVIRFASGFGGGIGRTKHICGAVTGALMALGTVKGRANPFHKDTPMERSAELREDIYPIFAQFITELEETYGSVECAQLTAKFEDFNGKEKRVSCGKMISHCAELAAKYAEKL